MKTYIIATIMLFALVSGATATIYTTDWNTYTRNNNAHYATPNQIWTDTTWVYYYDGSATANQNMYITLSIYSPESYLIESTGSTYVSAGSTLSRSGNYNSTGTYTIRHLDYYYYDLNYNYATCTGAATVVTGNAVHTISGTFDCVNHVVLQIDTGSSYRTLLNDTSSPYNFDIMSGEDYKLLFSNGHSYEFTCSDDVVYNYDACSYYAINILDNCANPLINPTTTIFENMTDIIYQGNDNPVQLMIPTDIQIGNCIQVIIDTHDGAIQFNDYVTEIEQDVYHPVVDWYLNVRVVDDSTDAVITSARVTKSQTCSIIPPNAGYALTQSDGGVDFAGLANSDVAIKVEKTGYTTYYGNIGLNFDAWCPGGMFTVFMNASGGNSTDNWHNGTHNDTQNVDGAGGETLPVNHGWGCGVYFKNLANKITDTINDTDAHVDMYYWVKGGDATLKFQSQEYTYWYTDQEYTVTNNTYEYRRILNADFLDHTTAYRGYIYNTTTECNCIQVLNVINVSYEQTTHYENLTSQCAFAHKLAGNQIDYRSDIVVNIYGNSSNTTLLNITAYLHNGTSMVASKSLNWADFVTGSPKWWYEWHPTYNYKSGFNYTVNITGFNGYQLDIDEVWTADIVGNTLTVNTKDNHNVPITDATMFVGGWGSQVSGTLAYVEIAGLPDGETIYKATKSGYTSSGWDSINLSGADESVTCILVAQSEDSITGYKLKDDEIKAFFIPLMYMLLIMIIIGGLTNAAKQ